MNILVGGIGQETNIFSTQRVVYNDFTKFRGQEVIRCLDCYKSITDEGFELIPAIYARITPSGAMSKDEFLKFIDEFFGSIDPDVKIDGIYLTMHGAMYVNGIGSAEEYLLKELRNRYGHEILIFASFDSHGNMKKEIASLLNYATAYRTAPHIDVIETRERAVKNLVYCLKNNFKPSMLYIKIPVLLAGEKVITADYPANEIIQRLEELIDGNNVLDASFFCGFAWADNDYMSMGIMASVVQLSQEIENKLLEIADFVWEKRESFTYSVEAYEPEKAVSKAIDYAKSTTKGVIFISDSGDNITAGSAGDSAYMLNAIIDAGAQNTLLAGITDADVVELASKSKAGGNIEFHIGGSIDPSSFSMQITGVLVSTGEKSIGGQATPTKYAIVKAKGITIVITNQRFAFTDTKYLNEMGIDINDYKIAVIKLGYLFPEIAKVAAKNILAISPGNAYQDVARIDYKTKDVRFYPRDEMDYKSTL
ncbi:MAG: M81 family metallopeptidase [Defluviitaleaceae bacterium]|nr:M81 family metallopeptidase [Defluviitaleaceae bacterium]